MTTERTLIILQRDNLSKDAELIQYLVQSLGPLFTSVVYFDPYATHTSVFLDPQNKLVGLPTWVRKPYKALLLLRYPSHWLYFLTWFKSTEVPIADRCKKLTEYIVQLKQEGQKVFVLARSSGGRVASLIADKVGIEKIVCLGYPFKHPEKNIEPERYTHLEYMKTPILILQGSRDIYGGIEIQDTYPMSDAISFEFVDTDHDFTIEKRERELLVERITQYILHTDNRLA